MRILSSVLRTAQAFRLPSTSTWAAPALSRTFADAAVNVKMEEPVQKTPQVTVVEAGLKRFRPITPRLRHTVLIDKSNLWKGRPVRELTKRLKKHGGRNNSGQITVRHRGGGHKKLYRFIDFKRNLYDQPATVQRFEYDPCRTAFIALIAYEDNTVSYIIAPQGMKAGDVITSSKTEQLDVKPGMCMPIANMPIGAVFHNMELIPGKGGQIAKSAGTSCMLIDKRGKPGYALVMICSKEQRYVPLGCLGTIGAVSNPMHHMVNLGKAGRKRWLGWRPAVRGVAMNPVDHPMGGGEGKSSGGRPPCSPTAIMSKGWKTNRRKIKHPLIVVKRGGVRKK